ncbi:MAG: hypothetical protein F4X91_10575 [Nitrospinae bacterium]|nr:hypothetical protein [Nitrospinota bacterium]
MVAELLVEAAADLVDLADLGPAPLRARYHAADGGRPAVVFGKIRVPVRVRGCFWHEWPPCVASGTRRSACTPGSKSRECGFSG